MSGRRAGPSTTKQALLTAARQVFSDRGLDGTTREIAQLAGVDPAMIAHYFGSKGGLFEAVVSLNLDPASVMAPALDAPAESAADRLVTTLLHTWDTHAPALTALVRSATRDEKLAAQARTFILERAVRPVVTRFSPDPAEIDARSALLATQMTGLFLTRYVLRWEPLASADPAWIASNVAPTVQRYLTGPLTDALVSTTNRQ